MGDIWRRLIILSIHSSIQSFVECQGSSGLRKKSCELLPKTTSRSDSMDSTV